MDMSRALRNLFTGEARERPPTRYATLQAAHKAFGTWKAVAAQMGVSDRTLRRIRAGQVSPASAARVAQLGSTEDVRRAAVRPKAARRNAKMRTTPVRVRIQGVQGPRGWGQSDYTRLRTISCEIAPQAMASIHDAFMRGDDGLALQIWEDAVQESYGDGTIQGDGWEVERLDSIRFDV